MFKLGFWILLGVVLITAFRTEETVVTWIVHDKIEDVALIERLTYYNADPKQTDDSPLTTAPLWTIDTAMLNTCQLRWIAVSQKMIRDKIVAYGDTVLLTSGDPQIDGLWIVADCMALRWDDYGKTGYCADLLLPMPSNAEKKKIQKIKNQHQSYYSYKGLWSNVKLKRRSIISRRYTSRGDSLSEEVIQRR